MERLPTIITVQAAYVDAVNMVFSAMGAGENNISRAAIPADTADPNPSTIATHYIAMDMGADADKVATWQAMCSGILPPIDGAWGEAGIIGETEAKAALAFMTVASEAGLTAPGAPEAFLAGILTGKSLMLRPEGGAIG
jgi:hypothetical protein